MLTWRANMLRLLLIIFCMSLNPSSSSKQTSGISVSPGVAAFTPIALYSIMEETPGPLTLGDLLPLLIATESTSVSRTNVSSLSRIVFFPSTQPFSEYFQLHRRTQTNHGREVLTAYYLKLQKTIDLEEVCKIRIYGQDCSNAAQTANIAMRGRTCCCDTSLLFCSLQLQLAMISSHSNSPTLGIISHAQRQESFPVFIVEVRIFDANENPPTYSQSEYSLRVSEGPESMNIFQLPTARDADMGENGRITYSLSDIFVKSTTDADWLRCPSCSSLFRVVQKPLVKELSNGQDPLYLQINVELDREKESAYRLLVLAKDAGRPTQKTGTLHVSIEVLDSNDMRPEFLHPVYNLLVEENVPRGAFVGRFEAKDRDTGVNARISYSLRPKHKGLVENSFYTPADLTVPFSINERTGVLTVNGSLDRERKSEYTMYVEATDHGSPARSSESIVYITVLDINDNSPSVQIRTLTTTDRVREIYNVNTRVNELREFEMTVPENLPVDVIIAEIDALDPDAGTNGSVVCVLPSDVFSIRPWQPEPVTLFGAADGKSTLESDQYIKYHLYLSEPIDFERQQFFRLILTCHDSGTPFQRSTRSVINVFVSDENDNPPVLGNPEVIKPAWKMEEIVLDSWKGGHTELMKAMKEILATNTLLICVPKQLKINETFLRIPATDRDSENNAKLAFEIAVSEQMGSEDESQNAELFDADALTGHVYLKKSLDFMQQTRLLKIILTVWDLGFPSLNSTAHFYILITDENRNAPSIKIFNFGLIGSLSPFQEVNVSSGPNDTIPNIPFYIPKSKKFGMAIGQVQGTDRDSGIAGKLSYDLSFKHPDPLTLDDCWTNLRNAIVINSSSGVLSIGSSRVTECDTNMIPATVTVWDQGIPQKKSQVVLNFQEFDLTDKSPKLRLNEDFLTGPNQINLLEYSQGIQFNRSFPDFTSTFDYKLPLLRNDNATLLTTSTDLPYTFLTVENERISGLYEIGIDLENCSSAEYSPLTGALNFCIEGGQLNLMRPLRTADSNQSETIYLLISNVIWPSLPPTVLRLNVQLGNVGINSTYFRVTLTVGVVNETDCQKSIETRIFLDGTNRKDNNFKIYMLAVWAVVCILCLLLIAETIIIKRTQREHLNCRRFFCPGKRRQLPCVNLMYEGKHEITQGSSQGTAAGESSVNTRRTDLGKSEPAFSGINSCYVFSNPRTKSNSAPHTYPWQNDGCSPADRQLYQLHPADLQPGTIYLHVLPSSAVTVNRNNEWTNRQVQSSRPGESSMTGESVGAEVFCQTKSGFHETRGEKYVPVDIIVHNNLSADKLVELELPECLCTRVSDRSDERLW